MLSLGFEKTKAGAFKKEKLVKTVPSASIAFILLGRYQVRLNNQVLSWKGRPLGDETYLNIFFTVCLLVKGQLTFQDKLLATFITNLHAPMSNVHVLLQVPASIKHPGALLTGQCLFLFTLSFLDWRFGLLCGPLLTLRWLYTLPTTSRSSGVGEVAAAATEAALLVLLCVTLTFSTIFSFFFCLSFSP